jgi:pyruvate formate lyase activating enzyme
MMVPEFVLLVSCLDGVREIHLLLYHTTGIEKHARLDLGYRLMGIVPPSQDHVSQLVEELERLSLAVTIGG